MVLDKNGKVIVIDTSGAVRQMFHDLLKNCGFTSIVGVSSIKDAVGLLEVDPIEWIITPLFRESEINGLQLLNLLVKYPVLKRTKVSFILEAKEFDFIPHAYEKGMFCHFIKPFNKDTMTQEFDHLNKLCEKYSHPTLVSIEYLEKHMIKEGKYKNLLELYSQVLELFPGNADLLFKQIKPNFNVGFKERAKSGIRQVRLISAEHQDKTKELAGELFGEDAQKILEGSDDEDGVTDDLLGINSCVVVDPDDASRQNIEKILTKLGVKNFHSFEDGEAAWEWINEQKSLDLMLQEWRIPKLTGPLLLQRVRKKFPAISIIAVSSLLKESDMPLIKEMGILSMVSKPVDQELLIRTLIHTVQQNRLPSNIKVLEQKVFQLIEGKKIEEAEQYYLKFRETKDVPASLVAKIEAQFSYARGDYSHARDLAIDAFKTNKDSITLLNLLGKCLMQLKDFMTALKCFEKAQAMSPMNVQHLCSIAEVNQEMGRSEEANEALDQAKSVDEGNEMVTSTEVSVKLSRGETEAARKILGNLSSVSNVISYLNNKAVAYTKSGQVENGLELYNKTLEAIPEDNIEFKAVVSYNLALACIRQDKFEEALESLQTVVSFGKTKVYTKANSLIKRIKLSNKTGNKFELNESKEQKDGGTGNGNATGNEGEQQVHMAENSQLIQATLSIDPGDLCCYKLFAYKDELTQEVKDADKAAPRFTPREAVERSESAGLEKSLR